MFYNLEETTSTNDDARQECYHHSDVIIAQRQSAGRGQRGHTWVSTEGLNATFSVVLEPQNIEAKQQFLISQITAIALVETMAHYGLEAKIKWTNDIYIGECKVVGVLIENRLAGAKLSRVIIGVGININQMEFDPSLPNPTSMIRERGDGLEISREEVIERFYTSLMEWYARLEGGALEEVRVAYHSKIYRLDEQHTFRLPEEGLFRGTILGVEQSGALIIRHSEGRVYAYQFKEVEFVIDERGR